MREMLNGILQLTFKECQDARQIFKVTQEMKGYIDKEGIDNLIKAIELRQRWMEQSDDIKKKINKKMNKLCMKYNIENLDKIDQDLYPDVKEIIFNNRQIQEIYKKVFEIEKQNQKKANGLLKGYKDKIINIQQGKQAYSAYGRQVTGQPLLLNKVK